MEMTASLHHLWLVTSHLGLSDLQVPWSPASLFFRGAGSMSQTPSLLQSCLLQVYTQSYFNESKRSTQAVHLLTAPRSASPLKTQVLRGLLSPFSCDQADNCFSPTHCVDQTCCMCLLPQLRNIPCSKVFLLLKDRRASLKSPTILSP